MAPALPSPPARCSPGSSPRPSGAERSRPTRCARRRHGGSARRPAPGPRALTVEEARQLSERLAADSESVALDLPDLVEFMLGTGVRIGEACALRWSAVDLDAATARIGATLIRVPGSGLEIQE